MEMPTEDQLAKEIPRYQEMTNVILRSSDDVEFRACEYLLTLASPFFESMFSLPKPSEISEGDYSNGLPVIPVTENSYIIRLLLKFCSPRWLGEDPVLETLADIQALYNAANKYDMENLATHVRELLLSPRFVTAEPMRVAAIACHYKWERGLRVSALNSLRMPAPLPFAQELECMTAAQYHHIGTYRALCIDAALSRATEARWISCDSSFIWARCHDCPGHKYSSRYPRQCLWWMECRADYREALRAQPCGATVMGQDLLNIAKDRAEVCRTCRKYAAEDLLRFSLSLSSDIDEEVAKVELMVCF